MIDYSFRLPSAFDNRSLKLEVWEAILSQTILGSATLGKYKLEKTNHAFIEQVIPLTGLTDHICIIKPT